MALDAAAATAALKKVLDPELKRDLVSLGMVKDIAVDGGTVRLTVELTTPACPLKDSSARAAMAGLRAICPPKIVRTAATIFSGPSLFIT